VRARQSENFNLLSVRNDLDFPTNKTRKRLKKKDEIIYLLDANTVYIVILNESFFYLKAHSSIFHEKLNYIPGTSEAAIAARFCTRARS
jgi:hypothetical protein